MIQDIYPYHYDVAYTPSSPSGPDFVYIFPEENRVLLKSDGTTFRYEEVREFFPQECFRYLFRISERSFSGWIQKPAVREAPVRRITGLFPGILSLSRSGTFGRSTRF